MQRLVDASDNKFQPRTADVPVEFRRVREFGRLDHCNDQTPWKLSEVQTHLYSRMMGDEVPFVLCANVDL